MTDGWADLVLHVLFTYCVWMKREFMQVNAMHTLTSRTTQTDFHKCLRSITCRTWRESKLSVKRTHTPGRTSDSWILISPLFDGKCNLGSRISEQTQEPTIFVLSQKELKISEISSHRPLKRTPKFQTAKVHCVACYVCRILWFAARSHTGSPLALELNWWKKVYNL